jgi:hypothetical protein
MIPMPQDIPGSITLMCFMWWVVKGFAVAKEVSDESSYNHGASFLLSLMTTAAFIFSIRVLIAWVWC